MNITTSISIELLTLVAAVIFLRKDPDLTWKGMIAYMLFVVVVETTGRELHSRTHSNSWLYNIYIIGEAVGNSLFFSSFLKKYTNSRPLIMTGFVVFLFLYAGEILYHGFWKFNDLTTTVMSLIFIGYGIYYFYLLLKDDEYVVVESHAQFWWVTGTAFFYFGSTVSNLFFLLVTFDGKQTFPLRHYVYVTLICILYVCWIYSFVCRYRYRKRPSSSSL